MDTLNKTIHRIERAAMTLNACDATDSTMYDAAWMKPAFSGETCQRLLDTVREIIANERVYEMWLDTFGTCEFDVEAALRELERDQQRDSADLVIRTDVSYIEANKGRPYSAWLLVDSNATGEGRALHCGHYATKFAALNACKETARAIKESNALMNQTVYIEESE